MTDETTTEKPKKAEQTVPDVLNSPLKVGDIVLYIGKGRGVRRLKAGRIVKITPKQARIRDIHTGSEQSTARNQFVEAPAHLAQLADFPDDWVAAGFALHA